MMKIRYILALMSSIFFAAAVNAAEKMYLQQGALELSVKNQHFILKKNGKNLLDLAQINFNYLPVENWQLQRRSENQMIFKATLPASVDFYRTAIDTQPRQVELTVSLSGDTLRFYSAPVWGRQVTLEFAHQGDHFFGLSAPLQPDNQLSPDLTGSITQVDVHSEDAAFRENYASAFSAFFISSAGYGAFFDSFARGRYEFAINGRNRIHHDTGTLDWYVFVGDDGAAIHKAYFDLIGAPKKVPAWGIGPVGWRDQNRGADEILDDLEKIAARKIPFTAWFVDRPYSDGNHAWSKLNFSSAFAQPEKWINSIRQDHGMEFMTWVATATFGDTRFAKHLPGKFTYMDLSDSTTVQEYQTELTRLQYSVGVRGHKIDRGDEGFPFLEEWSDGTPLPARRNRYAFLMAQMHHQALQSAWGDDQMTFARTAIHRTQPYLSAIWGGDPRTTWEGLQANFANAMRSGFMGFPIWGTDVGGYQGDGYIPENLYLRWLQAGSMTGLFEIKLDGAGGSGRDRMPWQYSEQFQARFRAILDDRMRLLPYLYSLANTSALTGVLMQPMAYRHLADKNTYAIWDQFYLGEALLVAPVFDANLHRRVYLPPGEWCNYDNPGERYRGGRSIEVNADLETLPRFVKENSLYVTGTIYRGNDRRWNTEKPSLALHAFPSVREGKTQFIYVDMLDGNAQKIIRMEKTDAELLIRGPAVAALNQVELIVHKKPKTVAVNGMEVPVEYVAEQGVMRVALEEGSTFDVRIKF